MAGNLPVFIRNDVRGPYQYARLQAENPGVAAPVPQTGQDLVGNIIQMTASGRFGFVLKSSVVIDVNIYWVHWFHNSRETLIFLDDLNSFKIPARSDVHYCNLSYAGTRVILSRQNLGLPPADLERFQQVTFFLTRRISFTSLYSCIFFRPATMTVAEFNSIRLRTHLINTASLQ